MYTSILACAAAIVLSVAPVGAQHPGHASAPPAPSTERAPAPSPDSRPLSTSDAVKVSQALFREVEKAARAGDEARLGELATRYEQAIDDVVRSVEGERPDERAYARDLGLAQRSLSRQLQQLEALASSTAAAGESLTRLIDAAITGHDAVLAQQDAFRGTQAPTVSGTGTHRGGSGHSCGGGRWRLFPWHD